MAVAGLAGRVVGQVLGARVVDLPLVGGGALPLVGNILLIMVRY